jgi:hypothetical protein
VFIDLRLAVLVCFVGIVDNHCFNKLSLYHH